VTGRIAAMDLLIVKEYIRSVCLQKLCFGQATQKNGFIDPHIPRSQGSDNPLVSRCRAGRHQRGPNGRVRVGQCLLQPL
jgi:hypothetical protein